MESRLRVNNGLYVGPCIGPLIGPAQKLLARVTHYPLMMTGTVRRTIRNSDQLIAAKKAVMDPHIQEVVASSTFETVFVRDKGIMLGGEVWITHGNTGFRLGAITLE